MLERFVAVQANGGLLGIAYCSPIGEEMLARHGAFSVSICLGSYGAKTACLAILPLHLHAWPQEACRTLHDQPHHCRRGDANRSPQEAGFVPYGFSVALQVTLGPCEEDVPH